MTTAYFDTPAIVPLIVEEAGLDEAKRLWRDRGDYRIIYSVNDPAKVVAVHRIHHRSSAYRPR